MINDKRRAHREQQGGLSQVGQGQKPARHRGFKRANYGYMRPCIARAATKRKETDTIKRNRMYIIKEELQAKTPKLVCIEILMP